MDDRNGPGGRRSNDTYGIEATAPEEFGLVQVWWGDGKGKTTAALGMAFRAAGHGFRVHVLQFMKGGAASVEDARGEYNAMTVMPGMSYENRGHFGWHALPDGTDDRRHAAEVTAGIHRVRDLIERVQAIDLSEPLPLTGDPDDGMHMLVLDELLYAVERELVDPETIIGLLEAKPERLELVLTGGHTHPEYLEAHVDLMSEVTKTKHPIDAGQPARKGTEY